MRFVRGVLAILLSLGLVVAAVWVVGPELMVWWAATEVKGQATEVARLARRPIHADACRQSGTRTNTLPLMAYQLRFEDEKNYVIEAVCSNVTKSAIEVVRKQLPFRVEKDSGYSGIRVLTAGAEAVDSRVVLNLLGRKWWVGFEEGKIKMARVWKRERVAAGGEVDNTCSGWGYRCCSEVNQEGRGEKVSKGVMDCPGSCYHTCLSIPAIASFVTDPYLDEERTARVIGSEQVTFSWSVLDLDGTVESVNLNFGDGQTQSFDGESGMATHQYACSSRCVFKVGLAAVDNDGLASKATPMSQLTIVVGN